jgi:hypothetical protein
VRSSSEDLADLLGRLSQFLLKSSYQFIVLAFRVGQVVIRKLSVLLLQLAFYLVPRTLELQFVHTVNVRFSTRFRPSGILKTSQGVGLVAFACFVDVACRSRKRKCESRSL